MKPISTSVVFIILALSIFFIEDVRLKTHEEELYTKKYVKTILENAAEDAAIVLKSSSQVYRVNRNVLEDIDEKKVFDTFLRRLASNFNVYSETEIERFNRYVPFMMIVLEDGYYVSQLEKIEKKGGEYLKRTITPFKRYCIEADGVYYFLSLSGNITALYRLNNEEYSELSAPKDEFFHLVKEGRTFSYIKGVESEKFILARLSEDVKKCIGSYNAKMKKYGKTLDLDYKSIYNSVGKSKHGPCMVFAFSGLDSKMSTDVIMSSSFKLKKNEQYFGFILNGIRYYARKDVLKNLNAPEKDIFSSEFEAAKNGYFKYLDGNNKMNK